MIDAINWYWQYGSKREGEYSISVGQWLDAIEQMRRRDAAIRRNSASDKACLAVWGPSQSGKSTMISDAIDGQDSGSGRDSALTWSENELARFTGDRTLYPDTVIFNPYNSGSDGSGVPTRYVLQEQVEDIEHPVRVQVATRTQVMLALAIGYLEECGTVLEKRQTHLQYDLDLYRRAVNAVALKAKTGNALNRKAVELLQDFSDVIAIAMMTQDRYRNLQENWTQLRLELLNNTRLLSDAEAAEQLVDTILWDNAPALNELFRRICRTLEFVETNWGERPIYASLRVANLFLDINTLENRGYENSQGRIHPCECLGCIVKEDKVLLDLNGEKCLDICGNNFGLMQAIVNELQVPLKKQVLEKNGKTSFLALLSKADYLDFPGVPTRDTGVDAATKINPGKCSENELFTRVLKQGKTLSMIFMHTREYGIDSFIILNRTDLPAKKTAVVGQGIRSWLRAYEPNWEVDKKAPLKFYMNLTFFAVEARKAFDGAVHPQNIAVYADRIKQYDFANPENMRMFVTTYPHLGSTHDYAFPENVGQETKNRVMQMFYDDQALRSISNLSLEDYQAVFNDDDGGVDYLFQQIANEISSEKRLAYCRDILKTDEERYKALLEDKLPRASEDDSQAKKALLTAVLDGMRGRLGLIENQPFNADDLSGAIQACSTLVKHLLTVPADMLEPIPKEAWRMELQKLKKYVGTQLSKWCEYQLANVGEMPGVDAIVPDFSAFLGILKNSCNKEELGKFVKEKLGYYADSTSCDVNRRYLAFAISNALLYNNTSKSLERDGSEDCFGDDGIALGGDVHSKLRLFQAYSEEARKPLNYPAYHALVAPFLLRLKAIREHLQAEEPVHQPGEQEIAELYARRFGASSEHIPQA